MGMFTSGWSGGGQQFIRSKVNDGTMSTIVYVGPKRDPVHPDTPTIGELMTNPEDKRMVELILARMVLGRPFIAPPGIPKDRLEMLRTAFRKAFEDPDLKKEAVQRQVAIDPMWGDEAQAAIESIYGAPPAVIERLQKIAAVGMTK
jgi:tripartite-type tricarboxylate transporter receptor subunit TctC